MDQNDIEVESESARDVSVIRPVYSSSGRLDMYRLHVCSEDALVSWDAPLEHYKRILEPT